jgi:hypothetical protein
MQFGALHRCARRTGVNDILAGHGWGAALLVESDLVPRILDVGRMAALVDYDGRYDWAKRGGFLAVRCHG